MKKILLILVAAFISVSAYAQGTVNFATGSATVTRAAEKGGGSVPTGTTYMAGLFFAPVGVTDENMFMQLGASAGFAPVPGKINAGTRTTPEFGTFNFQVRVWEVADPNHTGMSDIVVVTTGNPNGMPTPTLPASLGLTSFQMVVVPEPSVIALGALGAGALLLLRRRK
jgi:hypothetical protein